MPRARPGPDERRVRRHAGRRVAPCARAGARLPGRGGAGRHPADGSRARGSRARSPRRGGGARAAAALLDRGTRAPLAGRTGPVRGGIAFERAVRPGRDRARGDGGHLRPRGGASGRRATPRCAGRPRSGRHCRCGGRAGSDRALRQPRRTGPEALPWIDIHQLKWAYPRRRGGGTCLGTTPRDRSCPGARSPPHRGDHRTGCGGARSGPGARRGRPRGHRA